MITQIGKGLFGLPRAAPGGLLASLLVSFLATAGLFYVNIMAALVTGLQDALQFTPQEAGLTASANVYGAALGALVPVFFATRIPWRKAAMFALLALIAADLLSMLVASPPLMIATRFIHGMFGGFLVGTAFTVIARMPAPDRTFGMLLFVQFGLGGLGLMFLPRMAPVFGMSSLFLSLVAFSLCSLAMLPFIPEYAVTPRAPRDAGSPSRRGPLIAALGAVFLFQAANMALAAYIIDLGKAYGLGVGFISTTLGVANWLGLAGALAVVGLGARWGRFGPIVVGLCATIGGVLAFHASGVSWVFAAANVLTAITWAFTIPFLLGLCAAFDAGGRTAALAGFCSKLGLASGPAAAALAFGGKDFPRLITFCGICLIACLAAAVWPARTIDRDLLPPA